MLLRLISCVLVAICCLTATPNATIEGIAAEFNLPLYVRKGTPGIADDWNYAISRAETPLVTIAHQDDVYCPDYSTRMLAAVNSVTDPLLFFTDYGELRDGKEVDNNTLLQAKRRLLYTLRDGRHATSRLVRRRALSLGCAICCPSDTLNLALLSTPPFSNSFKCDLD